jgi:hypothetical protein
MAWFARRFVSPERQLDECGEDDDRDDAEIPAEEQHCEAFRLHVLRRGRNAQKKRPRQQASTGRVREVSDTRWR